MTRGNRRLPLMDLNQLTAALQCPTVMVRMTEPQILPSNVWTPLMWGEILFDPRSDCDPHPPHAFICPASARWCARLTKLWLADVHPATVSLGVRVGDDEPAVVFHHLLGGQSPDDRDDGVPAPIAELSYSALFSGGEGERVQLVIRHSAGSKLLCEERAEVQMVPHLLIEYVGPDPKRVPA